MYAVLRLSAEEGKGRLPAGHLLRCWLRPKSTSAAAEGKALCRAETDIRKNLGKLKVAQLNGIMRSCGLTQGVGKEQKIVTLAAFIKASQELSHHRYFSSKKRKPRSVDKIHSAFIPDEVVSIDIGFKNLAFAHISRGGEVLGWQRIELLKEAVFEPWVLAEVVERFVRDRLPIRPASSCTYIIEHQRFRSQGSAAVTNSVMVNNLVETLLYANLRHVGAHVEAINPTLVSAHWGFIEGRGTSRADLLSSGSSAGSACCDPSLGAKPQIRTKEPQTGRRRKDDDRLCQLIPHMDQVLTSQRRITNAQQTLIMHALGESRQQKRLVRTMTRDADDLAQKSSKALSTVREMRRRLIKKERTVAMVQSWILSFLLSEAYAAKGVVDAALLQEIQQHAGDVALTQPLAASSSTKFTAASAKMFSDEKKKDDLCDCLIQGVAWYDWQRHVVETLNAYGSTQIAGLLQGAGEKANKQTRQPQVIR